MKSLFGALILSLSFVAPMQLCAQAEEQPTSTKWLELERPDGSKGLMMEPALLAAGSRVHLVWTGTNETIRRPEVFHSSLSGGDKTFKTARAPFYGKNKGRVRKIAIGQTRELIGILFQRTLTQGNDAYEVLLSISGDQGWSWSNTIEVDSYVGDRTGGTAVAIEGRQGSNRPEFALAWSRDFGNVRAANFDIKSSVRPEGTLVGQHSSEAMKMGVGSLGRDGFSVVFNNGTGLATSHVKALVGKISEATTFLRGRFGMGFSVASKPSGPSRMAVAIGDTIQAYTSNETSWKSDEQPGKLPFQAGNVDIKCDMDQGKDLHLALLREKGDAFELWYIGQHKQKWGTAELVHSFDDKTEMRGFDITAANDYVFIVGSQGFHAKLFRREI